MGRHGKGEGGRTSESGVREVRLGRRERRRERRRVRRREGQGGGRERTEVWTEQTGSMWYKTSRSEPRH